MDETYLTINQLAARWNVTRKTLENKKREGIGPQPFHLFPGKGGLRYRQSEVLAWEEQQQRASAVATPEAQQ